MVGFLARRADTKMVFGRGKIFITRLEYVHAVRAYLGAFAAPDALAASVNNIFTDFIAET